MYLGCLTVGAVGRRVYNIALSSAKGPTNDLHMDYIDAPIHMHIYTYKSLSIVYTYICICIRAGCIRKSRYNGLYMHIRLIYLCIYVYTLSWVLIMQISMYVGVYVCENVCLCAHHALRLLVCNACCMQKYPCVRSLAFNVNCPQSIVFTRDPL